MEGSDEHGRGRESLHTWDGIHLERKLSLQNNGAQMDQNLYSLRPPPPPQPTSNLSSLVHTNSFEADELEVVTPWYPATSPQVSVTSLWFPAFLSQLSPSLPLFLSLSRVILGHLSRPSLSPSGYIAGRLPDSRCFLKFYIIIYYYSF